MSRRRNVFKVSMRSLPSQPHRGRRVDGFVCHADDLVPACYMGF